MPSSEALDQQLAYEVFRRSFRQRTVKTQQANMVNTQCAQPLDLLARGHQPRHAERALEILARQRLETQHHRFQLPFARTRQRPADQGLMPQMQTVKSANGNRTSTQGQAPAARVAKQETHEAVEYSGRCRRPAQALGTGPCDGPQTSGRASHSGEVGQMERDDRDQYREKDNDHR